MTPICHQLGYVYPMCPYLSVSWTYFQNMPASGTYPARKADADDRKELGYGR